MFNGKGQRWANGCLATTRHCLLPHSKEATLVAVILLQPLDSVQCMKIPSGPKQLHSLSCGCFLVQPLMENTYCLIPEYSTADTFLELWVGSPDLPSGGTT